MTTADRLNARATAALHDSVTSAREHAGRDRLLTRVQRDGLLALAAVYPRPGRRGGYRNTRTRLDTAADPTVAFLNGPVIVALHEAGMVKVGWELESGWEDTNAAYGGHVYLTERGMVEAVTLIEAVEAAAIPEAQAA